MTQNSLIELNVGGVFYTTSKSTMARFENSMLYTIVNSEIPTLKDGQGRIFIDRDGAIFRHVLNFVRCGVLFLPDDFVEYEQLRQEADFYLIPELVESIDNLAKVEEPIKDKKEQRVLVSFISDYKTGLVFCAHGNVDFLENMYSSESDKQSLVDYTSRYNYYKNLGSSILLIWGYNMYAYNQQLVNGLMGTDILELIKSYEQRSNNSPFRLPKILDRNDMYSLLENPILMGSHVIKDEGATKQIYCSVGDKLVIKKNYLFETFSYTKTR